MISKANLPKFIGVVVHCLVMSKSLWPHGLKHARLPCPSPSPWACSNSCPLSRWCYAMILSSVIPFSSWLSSFPESGSFLMSQYFASGGQCIGASASVFPVNFQCWFPLELTGLISSVPATLKNLPQHHTSKAPILWCSAFFMVQLSHQYMTAGKTTALTTWTFVGKVIPLIFNTMSRFIIAFLPRSKHLLISLLQSPSAVIWRPKKIKPVTVSIVSPSICHEVMGLDALILVFWMLSYEQAFSLSSLTIKRVFSSFLLSAIRVVSSVYLRLLIFLPVIFIPSYASSSPAFCMMYSAYKNKQGENIQPWGILSQFLTSPFFNIWF